MESSALSPVSSYAEIRQNMAVWRQYGEDNYEKLLVAALQSGVGIYYIPEEVPFFVPGYAIAYNNLSIEQIAQLSSAQESSYTNIGVANFVRTKS